MKVNVKKSVAVAVKAPARSVKPNATVKAQVTTKSSRAAKPASLEGRLSPENVDKSSCYVGSYIPVMGIVGQIIGKEIPTGLTQKGVLLTYGNKPGILLREVLHDKAKDHYRLADCEKYGSVAALNNSGKKHFRAEILPMDEVVKMAKKVNKVVTMKRYEDDKEITVALLNPLGDQYVAGLVMHNGKPRIYNMEHPTSNVHQTKSLVHVDPKDAGISADKFLRS